MKKLRYYLFSLFLFGLLGCSNLLDTNPTNFYSQETYWQNSQHALNALTGCYQALTNSDLYDAQIPFMFEAMSPNAFNYDNQGAAGDIARGVHTATTLGINNFMWRGCYRGIGRCNTLLSNIERIDMDSQLKSRIIGEAKFLRAFYYYRLNILFNGVPLIIDEPDPAKQATLPRNSYDEVLKQVFKDLNDAASVLPASYSKSDKGRVTKGAALALKARALLQNYEYNEVVNTIEEIFDLNVYSLYPNYNGIFRKANEGNQEIIFDIRFQAPELTNSYDIISFSMVLHLLIS